MDIQTIKKALDFKNSHIHLIDWALNKNCSISVDVDGFEKLIKSKIFCEIKKIVESDDKTKISIYDENDNFKGWALIIHFNGGQDCVSDYSANKFMNSWAEDSEKFYNELEID